MRTGHRYSICCLLLLLLPALTVNLLLLLLHRCYADDLRVPAEEGEQPAAKTVDPKPPVDALFLTCTALLLLIGQPLEELAAAATERALLSNQTTFRCYWQAVIDLDLSLIWICHVALLFHAVAEWVEFMKGSAGVQRVVSLLTDSEVKTYAGGRGGTSSSSRGVSSTSGSCEQQQQQRECTTSGITVTHFHFHAGNLQGTGAGTCDALACDVMACSMSRGTVLMAARKGTGGTDFSTSSV
jgi:hypothetical protein